MRKLLLGLVFTIIVLGLSHILMIGLVSFVQWENYFNLNFGLWDKGGRASYFFVQIILCLMCIGITIEGD